MQLNEMSKDYSMLVDVENGLADRRIFTDESIYELEIKTIFQKSWLFIGHESEIPNPGDYATRYMANEPIILLRDSKGTIRAFLNSCPHRGPQICRADYGNAQSFTCRYHGWTFLNNGQLISTAGEKELYEGKMDFSRWGLLPLAKVETYKGLIFATWDPESPSLDAYLGDMKWYIDLHFGRTPQNMEVLGPPHRWEVEMNWKVGALNFGADGPHAVWVHGHAVEAMLGAAKEQLAGALMQSPAICLNNGHATIMGLLPEQAPSNLGFCPDLISLYRDTLEPTQDKLRSKLLVQVANVFPNFSFQGAGGFLNLRTWVPLGPNRVQVWNWFAVEKEASESWKKEVAARAIRMVSVSGTLDPDDTELWQAAGIGMKSNRMPVNFQMTLPWKNKPWKDFPGPGTAYASAYSEMSEFHILKEWQKRILER